MERLERQAAISSRLSARWCSYVADEFLACRSRLGTPIPSLFHPNAHAVIFFADLVHDTMPHLGRTRGEASLHFQCRNHRSWSLKCLDMFNRPHKVQRSKGFVVARIGTASSFRTFGELFSGRNDPSVLESRWSQVLTEASAFSDSETRLARAPPEIPSLRVPDPSAVDTPS